MMTQVSQLRELPEGASEIETTLVSIDKLAGVVDRLKNREMMDNKVGLPEKRAGSCGLVAVNSFSSYVTKCERIEYEHQTRMEPSR